MNFFMLIVIMFAMMLFLGFIALILILIRTGQRSVIRIDERARVVEPMHAERVERISREIEKIDGMLAAGRISAEEAAELKAALEGERSEWTANCAEFARQSGVACAQQARKRLAKSSNAVLAGVCGGLAEWFECDATLVRVVYMLLSLFTSAFPGLILYIILWIVMPQPEAGFSTSEPPTGATTGPRSKSGRNRWLIVLLILPLAMLLLLFLVAASFFCLRSSRHVVQQRHNIEAQEVQNPLLPETFASRRTFAGYTPALHPYEAVVYLSNTTAESGNDKTTILNRLGIQRYPTMGVVTSLPINDPDHGYSKWSLYFWSDTPEATLQETLTGLCIPPACKFVSLRLMPIQVK